MDVRRGNKDKERFYENVSGLKGYKGGHCVYVRWMGAQKQYYVGRSKSLWDGGLILPYMKEIVYYEEFTGKDAIRQTRKRRADIIQKCLASGLPVANKVLGHAYL